MTGYDLKKLIQESSFLYWSGNNNQIYKALVELLNAGFVTNEVRHQDSSPSKKIYTITSSGLAELRKWVVAPPEPP
ncbi:PadR family transcriptional regulator, partial [Paenibacillus riograndensis]